MTRPAFRSAALLAGGLLAAATIPAAAQTYRVDDSRSQVLSPSLRLKPDAPLARGSVPWRLSGDTAVRVVLDTSPWKGTQQARIYLELGGQPGTVAASWTTQGRLLAGTVQAGERTLVYAGPILDDMLEDTLRIRIQADGRRLSRPEQLGFTFEIEPGTR